MSSDTISFKSQEEEDVSSLQSEMPSISSEDEIEITQQLPKNLKKGDIIEIPVGVQIKLVEKKKQKKGKQKIIRTARGEVISRPVQAEEDVDFWFENDIEYVDVEIPVKLNGKKISSKIVIVPARKTKAGKLESRKKLVERAHQILDGEFTNDDLEALKFERKVRKSTFVFRDKIRMMVGPAGMLVPPPRTLQTKIYEKSLYQKLKPTINARGKFIQPKFAKLPKTITVKEYLQLDIRSRSEARDLMKSLFNMVKSGKKNSEEESMEAFEFKVTRPLPVALLENGSNPTDYNYNPISYNKYVEREYAEWVRSSKFQKLLKTDQAYVDQIYRECVDADTNMKFSILVVKVISDRYPESLKVDKPLDSWDRLLKKTYDPSLGRTENLIKLMVHISKTIQSPMEKANDIIRGYYAIPNKRQRYIVEQHKEELEKKDKHIEKRLEEFLRSVEKKSVSKSKSSSSSDALFDSSDDEEFIKGIEEAMEAKTPSRSISREEKEDSENSLFLELLNEVSNKYTITNNIEKFVNAISGGVDFLEPTKPHIHPGQKGKANPQATKNMKSFGGIENFESYLVRNLKRFILATTEIKQEIPGQGSVVVGDKNIWEEFPLNADTDHPFTLKQQIASDLRQYVQSGGYGKWKKYVEMMNKNKNEELELYAKNLGKSKKDAVIHYINSSIEERAKVLYPDVFVPAQITPKYNIVKSACRDLAKDVELWIAKKSAEEYVKGRWGYNEFMSKYEDMMKKEYEAANVSKNSPEKKQESVGKKSPNRKWEIVENAIFKRSKSVDDYLYGIARVMFFLDHTETGSKVLENINSKKIKLTDLPKLSIVQLIPELALTQPYTKEEIKIKKKEFKRDAKDKFRHAKKEAKVQLKNKKDTLQKRLDDGKLTEEEANEKYQQEKEKTNDIINKAKLQYEVEVTNLDTRLSKQNEQILSKLQQIEDAIQEHKEKLAEDILSYMNIGLRRRTKPRRPEPRLGLVDPKTKCINEVTKSTGLLMCKTSKGFMCLDEKKAKRNLKSGKEIVKPNGKPISKKLKKRLQKRFGMK